MGKYFRHAIGILVSAIFGTLLPILGVNPELLDPEAAARLSEAQAALETFLYLFGTFIWYPIVEKWLKRFPKLDLEGWIDRIWLKKEAKMTPPPQ